MIWLQALYERRLNWNFDKYERLFMRTEGWIERRQIWTTENLKDRRMKTETKEDKTLNEKTEEWRTTERLTLIWLNMSRQKQKKTWEVNCTRCWLYYFLWLMGSELTPCLGTRAHGPGMHNSVFFFHPHKKLKFLEEASSCKRISGGGFS